MSAAPPSRPSLAALAEARALGVCPHCRRPIEGAPNRCPHCRRLLGEAAHDLKRVAAEERVAIARQKNLADGLFLTALLLGGPLISFGGRVRLGLFVLLGGAGASVVYRWTRSSLLAALLIGGLGAGIVAVAVTDLAVGIEDPEQVGENARAAFVAALARDLEPEDGLVEARGPGSIVAWFQLGDDAAPDCGAYPEPLTRSHLAELGFVRVVIANRTEAGVVCSFKP